MEKWKSGEVEKWRRSGGKGMQMKHVGFAIKAWISDAYLLDTTGKDICSW